MYWHTYWISCKQAAFELPKIREFKWTGFNGHSKYKFQSLVKTCKHANRQADIQTCKQANMQTGRHAYRQTFQQEKHVNKQTFKICRQAYMYTLVQTNRVWLPFLQGIPSLDAFLTSGLLCSTSLFAISKSLFVSNTSMFVSNGLHETSFF